MKKILIVLTLMILMVGCTKKGSTISCSQKSELDGIKYEVTSIIEYDEKMVNKKTAKEIYTFENEAILTTYEGMMGLLKQVYEEANVNYEIVRDGLTLSTTSTIDYHTVDISALVSINPNEDKMMDSSKNHMDLNNMLKVYLEAGRECK